MIDYPPGNLSAEVVRGTRLLADDDAAVVLAFYPWARMNPYQALMHSSLWDSKIAPVPILDFSDLDSLPFGPAAVVFHLHWTSEIAGRARSELVARDNVASFLERIDGFIARGGKFLWTLHNVMPHVCRYPDVEIELRRELALRADLIHVHCAATPEAASEFYDLPQDRTRVVPHPSYGTYYDSVASSEQARFELGLSPDSTVIGTYGAMKGYKGLDRLQAGFSALTEEKEGRGLRLIAAGMTDRSDPVGDFVGWAETDPFVTADFRKVPLADLQLYLAATDVVVLPYRRSLNSGVALMALSQGIPIIGPDLGCIADLITGGAGLGFVADDDEAFVEALSRAPSLRSAHARDAARSVADRYAPKIVSSLLAAAIQDIARD